MILHLYPLCRPCHRHVFPLLWEAGLLQESNQGKCEWPWMRTMHHLLHFTNIIIT